MGPGRDASAVLPDGRCVEYWEGGDPDGRGVILHDGTPMTRVFGPVGHQAALSHGVRLVSVNRPGYGGTELPPAPPSLRAVGHDTAALARLLGMTEYALIGTSGGAPFAVATAVVDPDRVRGLALVGGVGPWRELADPTDDPLEVEERRLLARADAGDPGAWADYLAFHEREYGGLAALDDDERLNTFFDLSDGPPEGFFHPELWVANLAVVAARLQGFARDGFAFGGAWDIDLAEVVAPTTLWYGDADEAVTLTQGRWYVERISGADLVVLPGDDHGAVCFGHWDRRLATLVARWG